MTGVGNPHPSTEYALSWEAVRRHRLERSFLQGRAIRRDPIEIVRGVCGLQAQVQGAAELGLSVRCGADVAQIQRLTWRDHRFVRTWALRNTLYLLAAEDVAVWLAARRAARPHWNRVEGLTARDTERLTAAIARALDGRILSRRELAERVGKIMGSSFGERLLSPWGELLGPAATAGVLCCAEPRGTTATFARLDQWTKLESAPAPEEALRVVLRRYLHAYAPAKHGDFARWFGMEPAAAKAIFGSLGSELEEVLLPGFRGWTLRVESVGARSRPQAPSVRLVPQYDAYVLGFRPREELVEERHRRYIA